MDYDRDVLEGLEAPEVREVRAMRQDELLALFSEQREMVKPQLPKQMRARHQMLARLIAQGCTQRQAAAEVGYTETHVSILMQSQDFRELIANYTEIGDAAYVTQAERLAMVAQMAADELLERFEEQPESFTVTQLNALLATASDRSGYGPSSNTNVNVNVGLADRLNRSRERVREARLAAGIIDAEIVEES